MNGCCARCYSRYTRKVGKATVSRHDMPLPMSRDKTVLDPAVLYACLHVEVCAAPGSKCSDHAWAAAQVAFAALDEWLRERRSVKCLVCM